MERKSSVQALFESAARIAQKRKANAEPEPDMTLVEKIDKLPESIREQVAQTFVEKGKLKPGEYAEHCAKNFAATLRGKGRSSS
jgi:ribosome biogenesis GTPase A